MFLARANRTQYERISSRKNGTGVIIPTQPESDTYPLIVAALVFVVV
jgi:hypothetical protein